MADRLVDLQDHLIGRDDADPSCRRDSSAPPGAPAPGRRCAVRRRGSRPRRESRARPGDNRHDRRRCASASRCRRWRSRSSSARDSETADARGRRRSSPAACPSAVCQSPASQSTMRSAPSAARPRGAAGRSCRPASCSPTRLRTGESILAVAHLRAPARRAEQRDTRRSGAPTAAPARRRGASPPR